MSDSAQRGPAPVSPPPPRKRRWPWIVGGLGVVVVIALAVGAFLFQPWLIFVNTEVDDEIPTAVATQTPSTPGQPPPPTVDAPIVLSAGTFISHEHSTTGAASIIEKPDGTRVLAIENLDTTTGPDIHVWLSAGEVIEGISGWRTAASADHVDLGPIKGNRGNQVYEIPAEVELDDFGAVVLWCVRFSVSFGAAEMGAV